MRGEMIREKLRSGERVYGTHVCSLTNPVTAKMETAVELDFAFICNEHMPIDRTETSMLCQFYAAHGVSPCVRIPCPDAYYASMALDAGAQGITVPYVETVEEVKAIVGAVKYRPIKGKFLADMLDGTREPSAKTIEFLNRFNRDNYVIIGVESVEGVNNLEALLAVKGVDGVFLGPHDISVSMEIPEEYDNPLFLDLVEDVVRRCRACNVGVGLHIQWASVAPGLLDRLLDAGMNWIANGSDVCTLRDGLNQTLREIRKKSGDTYSRDGDAQIQVASCLG